jgi:hypothetical protein
MQDSNKIIQDVEYVLHYYNIKYDSINIREEYCIDIIVENSNGVPLLHLDEQDHTDEFHFSWWYCLKDIYSQW